MCMSKVYLREGSVDEIVIEEAIKVIDSDGTIEISSIFGDNKIIQGYFIKEINFTNNYTILCKKV